MIAQLFGNPVALAAVGILLLVIAFIVWLSWPISWRDGEGPLISEEQRDLCGRHFPWW